jgi:hypothetical protein
MAIASLTCLCWHTEARAQGEVETTVVTEGIAAVVGGDLARAEDEAISDAKRNAVEQAIGVFVKSETLGENYQVVQETILTKSEGYITWWEKVEGSRRVEKIEQHELLKIKIKAKVGLIKLIDDMSDIEEVYNSMQRPRIMVLIAEENLGRSCAETPASLAVIRSLQDRRFDVVDPEVVEQIKQRESARAIVERGDAQAAARLALEQGAEILVLGKAKSSKSDVPYGLDDSVNCCSARLDARIVYGDTGQNLFTPKPSEGRGASFADFQDAGLKALEDAGSRLISADARRFAAQVLARWAREVQNGRVLRVIAEGVSYDEFAALKKAIREFRGHVGFARESYEGRKGSLDVRTKLSPDEFHERLAAVKIGRKRVEITRTFGTVTSVTLK